MPEYTEINGEEGKILKEKFTSCFRTGYIKIKSTVLPEYYLKFVDRINQMEVRDDDLWVCSFPKTGR